MKALSIRQPWGWAILEAGKRVENRTWPTTYRGPVLLHVSAGMTLVEWQDACDDMRALGCIGKQAPVPLPGTLKRGGVIGQARVIACLDKEHTLESQIPARASEATRAARKAAEIRHGRTPTATAKAVWLDTVKFQTTGEALEQPEMEGWDTASAYKKLGPRGTAVRRKR